MSTIKIGNSAWWTVTRSDEEESDPTIMYVVTCSESVPGVPIWCGRAHDPADALAQAEGLPRALPPFGVRLTEALYALLVEERQAMLRMCRAGARWRTGAGTIPELLRAEDEVTERRAILLAALADAVSDSEGNGAVALARAACQAVASEILSPEPVAPPPGQCGCGEPAARKVTARDPQGFSIEGLSRVDVCEWCARTLAFVGMYGGEATLEFDPEYK